VRTDPERVYLTNGASEGIRIMMSMIVRDHNDGILVPIPQYPLYSALVTLNKAHLLPYLLDEDKNWGLDPVSLQSQIEIARSKGVCPRALVVINPGNPTGQVMTTADLQMIIKICYENDILILSDEVYQTNVYKEGSVFVSMRKVLHEMGAPYAKSVELVSFNSISKGVMGECGLRGGYFETHNLSPQAEELVFKLKSIELCSNTIGQTVVELMVNPPMIGVESVDTVTKYLTEYSELHTALRTKARMLTTTFNEMKNVTCTDIEGAMYGFPKV